MDEIVLKALSVKQPWANMIASGEKTIETRTWPTAYRGELLIVSSKRPPIAPAGSAVAIATVLDCRPMTRGDERAACCSVYPGAYAWVLANLRALKPFAVRGQLGIFEVKIPKAAIAWAGSTGQPASQGPDVAARTIPLLLDAAPDPRPRGRSAEGR
jgi:hypothetical protein